MVKLSQIFLVFAVLFGLCSSTFAAEYWVIREKKRCVIVKVKPADASVIFKGPFRDRKEAEVVIKECAPQRGAAVIEYWVIREPSGALVIVEGKPTGSAVIVKGPFRERKQAEVVIKQSPRGGAAAPERQPAEKPKAAPDRAPTGERPGVTKPMEKSAPAAGEKPGVKSGETPQPPHGERPGVTKPGEKSGPGGSEKPSASKEGKPQQ